MKDPLGVSPSNWESGNHTRQRNISFDLGGNRTHDLRIRSTVTSNGRLNPLIYRY